MEKFDNSATILPYTEDNQKVLEKMYKSVIIDPDSETIIARFASSDPESAKRIARDFCKEFNITEKYPAAIIMNKQPDRDMEPITVPYIFVDKQQQ